MTVYNTHSWNTNGLVTLDAKESALGDRVVDDSGRAVPSQRLSDGTLVFLASDVPALGSRHYRVGEGESVAPATPGRADGFTLDNGVVRVKVDPKSGNIVTLDRNGDSYNYIDSKVDGGANSCSWLPANIDSPVADSVISVAFTERGPLVNEIAVTSALKGCRGVTRCIRLVAGQPWVEISNTVDKLPLTEKDGIHFGFGFNVENPHTTIDIPWGVMEVEKDQWPQANRNWLAVQRWVNVANDARGVALCSLDAPLIEHGTRSANISLGWGGQGPWTEHLDPSATIYSWAMNNHWHTNFPLTQDGPVEFRYRLMPHSGLTLAQINRFGLEQSQPLLHVMSDSHKEAGQLVALDNENVYVTMVKPTERDNEFVVRLRSLSAEPETVRLSFPSRRPASVGLCETEETVTQPVTDTISMHPYGMAVIKVKY